MNIAQYIDHTILNADATQEDIKKVCDEAKQYHFYSVCVNSCHVAFVATELKHSHVKVTSVIGFPLGASSIEAKAFEAQNAVVQGAHEIDMVMNIGALKSKAQDYVFRDIEAVVKAVGEDAIVKVIIETSLLQDDEKILACKIAKAAGAHFVKTSTGFSTAGATVEDIQLMRQTVGISMGVKASGGIRDVEKAKKMLEAGATRIGASASVNIVRGIASPKDRY
ncbi:deoxyribose-phosphate aldolase [Clostridium formicaceticum]|uniref:Deoxyribose-phosphate aldolase n=1 Tax=Clostridium formicaceticum TaxID=1497 RepID=A0AAC9RLS4_9CLOT|nr:deoxyribose-phosphate aldolase [Clostridium formicaceticum]AOY77441.1 deoxyribose-phosphate aldolase [Clostridium formicaceticum]ARE87997.1 Deoxyribose-phosphate aldolase 2 [Clostridium formicaceticum]